MAESLEKDLSISESKIKGYFAVLADPQIGMSVAFDDPDEARNELIPLKVAVDAVSKLQPSPKFVFLAGDVQDAWPNLYGDAKVRERAMIQREAVKKEMQKFAKKRIPVQYTPGNHDIADAPTDEFIADYTKEFGPTFKTVDHGLGSQIQVVALNSQIYQHDTSTGARQKQNNDFAAALNNLNGDTRLLMILTHIPPFMDTITEKAGWANWAQEARKPVMEIIAKAVKGKNIKVAFVCGHFHTNVDKETTYTSDTNGKFDLHIMVSSSVTSTMWWTGQKFNVNGWLAPEHASMVAQKDVKKAFVEDIIGAIKDGYDPYAANKRSKAELTSMLADVDADAAKAAKKYTEDKLPRFHRSGVTLIAICQDAKKSLYSRQWLTVDSLHTDGKLWLAEACS